MAKKNHQELIAKYSYLIQYSEEDEAYIAQCAEMPSMKAHGSSPEKALKEIRIAMELALESLEEDGHEIPEPFSTMKFSGKLPLRMAPEIHRRIATEAKLAGVSINQYIISKLS